MINEKEMGEDLSKEQHDDLIKGEETPNSKEDSAKEEEQKVENVEEKNDTPASDSNAEVLDKVEKEDGPNNEETTIKEEEQEVENVEEKNDTPASDSNAEVLDKVEKEDGPNNEESTTKEDKNTNSVDDNEPSAEEEEEPIDYSALSKSELLELAVTLSKEDRFVKADNRLKQIAPFFNEIVSKEREAALTKFKEDGGEAGDFDFRDEDAIKFDGYYKIIKERKAKYFSNLEKEREDNYKHKLEVLEKLRLLVDGEENNTSINALKELQEEWKAIGPIPGQHVHTLWANYHAIIDRFYDHRSIYFELKELDRKKNLKAKLVICEKAEELSKLEDFREATSQLNELHEEFKHIGPVPRDEQEALWERFKSASDAVYANRKEYVEKQKEVFEGNLVKKINVVEKVKAFKGFDSDRINDWNAKTKEILAVQKEWEAIGGIPRDKAKAINKEFWGTFKGFFNDKNAFFKKLEAFRGENLEKKNQLVEKANEIKDSEDWGKAAEALKRLQRDWKEIGPVPEKHRNEVYERFRAACDHFFNKKREHDQEADKEFIGNLERKKEICSKISELSGSEEFTPEKIYDLVDQYAEIGFVPRKDIKFIKSEFDKAVQSVLKNAKGLNEDELSELKINLQLSQIKGGPDANRKLNRKENAIKRKISGLEEDVNLWQTNILFFANSKNADKLKSEFEEKIAKAKSDIVNLRKELKILNQN